MSFWTGLEAFTGHRPGAFTGMTMKDLFDKDMWDRMPRTWSGQRMPTGPTDIRTGRAGEPMMTNWARGGGGQEEVISRHRPDVPQPSSTALMKQNEMAAAYSAMSPQDKLFPYVPTPRAEARPVPGWTPPRNPAEVIQETGRYYGMGDPYSGWGGYIGSAKNAHMGMGASGYQVPQGYHQADPGGLLDMTTVKKEVDDPGVPNTVTQTIKQKVPANPTKTLMNMNQPGFLEKLGTGIGEQLSNLWDGSVLRHGAGAWDAMKDLAKKRHEEEMLRRQRGY